MNRAEDAVLDTSLSLLERLQTRPAPDDWRRLTELYTPLIRCWLRHDPSLRDEADDLTQEVLGVLVRELPGFRRQRAGSFRTWLKAITVNRLRARWRSRRSRPSAAGTDADPELLAQLEDPASALSRQWDREHDQYVVRGLLAVVEAEFAAATWQAFRRYVIDEVPPARVAAELGVSENVVLLAKSRVLKRLREAGRGLLD